MKLGKRDLRKLAYLFCASNLYGQIGGMDMDTEELNDVLEQLQPEMNRIVDELLRKSGAPGTCTTFEACVKRFRPFQLREEKKSKRAGKEPPLKHNPDCHLGSNHKQCPACLETEEGFS